MKTDFKHFISPEALKLQLNVLGWKLMNPYIYQDVAVFKPDFYPNNHVIALAKRGYIWAKGYTIIKYKDQEFNSVEELLDTWKYALNDFDNWNFLAEKEWVLTKDGKESLYFFDNLQAIPLRKKYRC
jgi:hypothetical protein|tara:strand:- start:2879 stop:3259 length:381 start_codon:yes stop_codon:yes gene_type:complete